jgi:hypothetical protein
MTTLAVLRPRAPRSRSFLAPALVAGWLLLTSSVWAEVERAGAAFPSAPASVPPRSSGAPAISAAASSLPASTAASASASVVSTPPVASSAVSSASTAPPAPPPAPTAPASAPAPPVRAGASAETPHRAPRAAKEEERNPYVHLFGALTIGDALRFNNPYRLGTQLGKTGQSLSISAPYVDVAGAALLGSADGLQHGVHLHLSTALTGISQSVFAPSYIVGVRRSSFTAYARGGFPIVLSPQTTTGLELAVGGLYYLRSGFALTAEAGESLFYGAATREVSATFIPLTYLQAGVAVDFEVLP